MLDTVGFIPWISSGVGIFPNISVPRAIKGRLPWPASSLTSAPNHEGSFFDKVLEGFFLTTTLAYTRAFGSVGGLNHPVVSICFSGYFASSNPDSDKTHSAIAGDFKFQLLGPVVLWDIYCFWKRFTRRVYE